MPWAEQTSFPREREITHYSTSSHFCFIHIWLCLFWIYKSVTCVFSSTIIAQSFGCVFGKSLKMLFVVVTSKSMTRTDLLWNSAMNPHLQFFLTTEPRFCSRSPQDVTYILGDRALDSKLLALMPSPLPLCLHDQATLLSGLSQGQRWKPKLGDFCQAPLIHRPVF